jgi:hypothetical protein
MEFWHAVTIVISAVLLGCGIIFNMGWLTGVGLAGLPLSLVWGLVATGPGSKYNPYHQH